MKKIAMIAMVLVVALAAVSARDKIVSADQLPKTAQDFISANFAGKTVQYVEKDFNEFEVQLSDRSEIKFGGNGEWESIKCYEGIPAGVLPEAVTSYVKKNFADAKIVEAEKDWNSIELKLSNRMEVFFDKDGKYMGQKYDD
ncbi:MAG: PepSY-like domain-containing protein [Spirochaetaceae bacterium]|nr:PepSY-like domain-containing protein [Spirochaetaceae bacterium]